MACTDLSFLSTVPYFQGLTAEDLARLNGRCRQRTLHASEIIVLEGQRTDALYMVRQGRVRIYKISPEGKEQVLFVAEPGTTFNDVAVFDRGPALATAEALTPGTCVCIVPASVMLHLFATDPRVAANVARVLPGRVRQLAALVADLSFRPIAQRVARLLLDEYVATGEVTLTKHEMAARVGTVREAVSRTLHDLERRGGITRQNNRIVEVHTSALLALLGTAPPATERVPRQPSAAIINLMDRELSLADCG